MSNSEASHVYSQVLETVINEVREEFENAGIDEQTLQDLKSLWKRKLTETRVAPFEWETHEAETLDAGLALPGGKSFKAEPEPTAMNLPQVNEPLAKIELQEVSVDGNGISALESQRRHREKAAKRSALLDNDEVGSELDDSDDDYLISEGEDEGPDENLVLCLYDKVTRTKARWKCALKDGVATINRRDYTFQKAQVEAEWV